MPLGARKHSLGWVATARRPQTRQVRIERIVSAVVAGPRPGP
jgi:uncharacterized protein YdeI (YjbR/CyaY-like superfamily)